jgi:hypothetical protein
LPVGPGERHEPPLEVGPGAGLALCQPGRDFAHGQQGHGRRLPHGLHRRGQRPDFGDLHLVVLEVPEAVLQLLQVRQHQRVRVAVVQRREELQRVPQLLAAFSQVMEGLVRRVLGDRRTPLGDLGERATGPLDGQDNNRFFFRTDIRASCRSWRLADRGQRGPPLPSKLAEPRRAQPASQRPALPRPPLPQVGPERLQVIRLGRAQAGRHVVEAEQVHVQVPGGSGQVAQPFELGRGML